MLLEWLHAVTWPTWSLSCYKWWVQYMSITSKDLRIASSTNCIESEWWNTSTIAMPHRWHPAAGSLEAKRCPSCRRHGQGVGLWQQDTRPAMAKRRRGDANMGQTPFFCIWDEYWVYMSMCDSFVIGISREWSSYPPENRVPKRNDNCSCRIWRL